VKNNIDNILRIAQSALGSILNPGKSKAELPKKESLKYPEIYLFRHGETFDNKNRVFSGWRDSKLTLTGKKQAKVLAAKLLKHKVDLCITSRLSRSKETAAIVFRDRQVKFEIDDRIIERNYGDLSGTSKEKLMREDFVNAVKFRRFYETRPPNGESLKDVKERVFPFCRELVERIRKTGENVALSAHGNSMKAIRLYFEKLDIVDVLTQENPLGQDFAEYVVTEEKVVVSRIPPKA